jgi:uncharacterized membrane protein
MDGDVNLSQSLWIVGECAGLDFEWESESEESMKKGCIASLKGACAEDRGRKPEALATATQDFYLSFSPRGLY